MPRAKRTALEEEPKQEEVREERSILDINLKEREEIGPVEDGEYTLRVRAVVPADLNTRKARLSVACEVVGNDFADDVWYVLWLPNPEDTPKNVNRKKTAIAQFMEALGLDSNVSRIDLEEWVGGEFNAFLRTEEYEGTTRNVVRGIV